ncbi:ribosomal protein S12 methylthiotransferase accessory factor [Paenibacillus castaneae]|uniref:TOMM precursor leader peptide-binding protein n=1 Tax=Paenibacillus castaneae TaxID=474957 RepID=UPI000C9A01A0|nr:TOMM precursor leader peptide-binding protein [Paenibacillus castaneae]NIK75175.1 ribosomal protein S12 methylthiotransferase accessory factor [Paenibacillus castaneae]
MNTVVALIGEGLLSDFVYEQLADHYKITRQKDLVSEIPEAVKLALVLNDEWNPSIHEMAEEVFQQSGTPWLRGFVSFGEGVVGPLVRPGEQGCSQCADMRRLLAGNDRKEMWELQHRQSMQSFIRRDAWASRTALLQMAHLIAEEAGKILRNSRAKTEERVYLINLQTLSSSMHFFLPDPQCPVCSFQPEDTASAALISLRPSLKVSADSYRCRPKDELKGVLSKEYLDARMGFLNGKMIDLTSPFADASINLPFFSGDEGCAGRTHSYADSEMTAILEGLERYCGMSPRGKQTTVHDSFHNINDQALDPVQVGVHAKENYERPNFPFMPFDPDQQIDWVWGYSFLQKRPLLVPERLAYYSSGCGHGFVYETSNGCALGGSLEEAIFYGIMEVVERDSFLMTWYAQLPLPRLDPFSAGDLELSLMVERLQEVAGYDVYLFNSTMEHGIPSVWALAKNRTQKGVNLICAAGAHPDPVKAVKSAIHEVAGMLLPFNDKLEKNREQYEEMLHDPFLVQQMEDHSMLYSLPQAEERLSFLLNSNVPLRTFQDEFKPRSSHSDLTEDLKGILSVFDQLKLNVIVVDQTTPETIRNGLHCVKVLIPGMLPMTFGHHLTRLSGLERVFKIPMVLGYTKEPLTSAQLNPHPHPFP